MKDVYKMTVRFDLTDARARALAEFMQTLDVKRYHSRNYFIIEALAKLITGNNVQKRDYRPVSPELREEIRNLDRTLAEYHFLRDHNVECAEDFVSCRKEIAEQIKAYETERQHIRNRIRRAKTPEEDNSLKEQCREITKKLTPLRKQLIICERIENKVPRLRALIEQEKQLEQGRYKYKYYHQNKTKQRSYER